jgi:nitroimidazol reductase NimA-like FMN-containing flavoprotein (pyridoxamine 5'-phosphate oxidase superfamily)
MPQKYPGNDPAELARLVADARVGHVGLIADGRPVVLPTAIALDTSSEHSLPSILLHGSTGSRWLRLVAKGIPVSLAVTSLDALVIARSAFESSMHYRSAVLFGTCRPVEDPSGALDRLTDALIPGRVAELRRPTGKELAATLTLRMSVQEWTLKVSDGWPDDPAEDVDGPAWAGVLPLITECGEAVPAPDLGPDRRVPESVVALQRTVLRRWRFGND